MKAGNLAGVGVGAEQKHPMEGPRGRQVVGVDSKTDRPDRQRCLDLALRKPAHRQEAVELAAFLDRLTDLHAEHGEPNRE